MGIYSSSNVSFEFWDNVFDTKISYARIEALSRDFTPTKVFNTIKKMKEGKFLDLMDCK